MNISDNNLATTKTILRVCVGIGSVIAIVGLMWLSKTAEFVGKASKASGTVVGLDYHSTSPRGGPTYAPVFTFTDVSGISYTKHSSSGSSYFTFKPGEKVVVLYDGAAPKNAEIDTFGQVWLGPIVLTVVGMAFGGLACRRLYVVIRGTRTESHTMPFTNENSDPSEKRSSGELIFGSILFSAFGIYPLFYILPMLIPWHFNFAAAFVMVFMAVYEVLIFRPVWKSVAELRRRWTIGRK